MHGVISSPARGTAHAANHARPRRHRKIRWSRTRVPVSPEGTIDNHGIRMNDRIARPTFSRRAARALRLVAFLASLAPQVARADSADEDARLEKAVTLDTQRRLMTTLGGWSAGSMLTGGAMLVASESTAVRWAGTQNLVWGAIDGAIALYALHENDALAESTKTAEEWRRERERVSRIFWINVGLDILYVVAGTALVALGRNERAIGSGQGVLVQGTFLLVFDTVGGLAMGQ